MFRRLMPAEIEEVRVSEIKADVNVDTCGTCCPTPILEATRAARKMQVGQIMELVATDVGSRMDIPIWCRRTGNQLLAQDQQGDKFRYFIRKLR